MNTKSVCIIVISDDIVLQKSNCDITDFLIGDFHNHHYNIGKIAILPVNERSIAEELVISTRYNDFILVVTDLSDGVVYRAMAKLFCQAEVAKCLNTECSEGKIVTPTFMNILNGSSYTIPHLNRIFLLHKKYVESCSRDVIDYLDKFKEGGLYSKLAMIQLNGKAISEVETIRNGNILIEVTKVADDKTIIKFSSKELRDVTEFEEYVRQLYNVTYCTADVRSELVYKDGSSHVMHALKTIEECFQLYGPENIFLSFNGGKDCTVLLHLTLVVLEKLYPNYRKPLLCYYVQSKTPFPEQNEFIEHCERYYNIAIVRYQLGIKDALEALLNERTYLKACLMGTRRTDPYSKDLNTFQMTDPNYPQIMRVNPLLDWHYANIWDYLLYYKVPYCSLYDMGYTSLGNVTNTVRNENLRYYDLFEQCEKYLAAYKLFNEANERSGRKQD